MELSMYFANDSGAPRISLSNYAVVLWTVFNKGEVDTLKINK